MSWQVIIAGDETGDVEFVIFGRIAQRLIKRTADALVANNPPGFIPDEIIRLLEKVFAFNVSFTEKTITSGNVSFQVNTIVAEIDGGNPLPVTPIQSQTSSIIFSQGVSSSVQGTPEEDSHASNTTSMVHNTDLAPTPQSTRDPDKNKVRYFSLE
jgi:replication factor A1